MSLTSRPAMMMTPPEPTADVLHLMSTACASIFLLILSVQLWKLRSNPGIRSVPSWKGRFKAVRILASPSQLGKPEASPLA